MIVTPPSVYASSLIRRKKEEMEKMAAQKIAEERGSTPPGHRRVPEEERLETLRTLREGSLYYFNERL